MADATAEPKEAKTLIKVLVCGIILLAIAGAIAALQNRATKDENEALKQQISTTQQENRKLSAPYEIWNAEDQEKAVSVASASVASYLAQPGGFSLTKWKENLAQYGTEEFQQWAEQADPSFRPSGYITGIGEKKFPTTQEATIMVKTTGGSYEVQLTRENDKTLVNSIKAKGEG